MTAKNISKFSSKMKINPIGHFLVPNARKLNEQEKEELLTKLGKNINALPKIYETDPVVISLEAKKDDIIEFERNDFGIKYKYYRVVIDEKYELPNE